ncbi:adenosylcobinamide amidohydrolase [Pseudooceanicola sp. CBS1P-1]|uniref:Adenosylcobinamide amidohydrolase n=1 Tax=Pseudooceanicola albus TaxID=2692189 RepID=A0A6L7FYP6_9RHOB|nr:MULTISPECIES: adenosylcobinamide amidohydrolase [Pseudooceanicola]MBT9383431.1 adenosylcobinamide amidohydrolase [Pseudooceanicola endophyticus]MXN16247.1 adenosylcobinamide amidohydrolase [Pseudooceanicola albus]
MTLTLHRPWLDFDLEDSCQVLSWAPWRPGLVPASRILWREVRNADLPPHLDATDWLERQLVARDASDAVCFLTARDVSAHHRAEAQVEGVHVTAVATLGLSNAERIGTRRPVIPRSWGTINLAVKCALPLAPAALIEALSIATQARTTALLEAQLPLETGPATGTGTDCIAIAAPEGSALHAGLHTPLGEAIGRAVLAVISAGVQDWRRAYAGTA